MSSEGRPGVVVEEEARPPASVSRSSLKLVVAEADKGTEKSTDVAELGAVSTLSTGCVGAIVVDVDDAPVLVAAVAGVDLGGTARLSLCLCCPCSWRCWVGCDVGAEEDGEVLEVVEDEDNW